ncbi:MAG: type II secretion system protein [Bacilli bacterium]|nr:type II secretion system protein [Bacilli bacterium]
MKKGFTLIELLAVIVILAVIALISTPLIINIINETKNKAKERTYEAIEQGARYYIMDNYSLDVEDDVLISIEDLKEYVKSIPEDATGEYVYVKNIGNKLTYYYTGRNKDDSSNLLRTLIENESSMIKENITVNGITVNKVIGSKESKSTMKNYVWYSGYLWQVLETNDDGIKMVMAYPITSIAFGESTNYSTSYIRQWLNEGGVFYDKLNRTDLLVDTVMCLDEASDVTTASITLTSNIT